MENTMFNDSLMFIGKKTGLKPWGHGFNLVNPLLVGTLDICHIFADVLQSSYLIQQYSVPS